jgi:hypothetical protein
MEILGGRALNRALLARQHLLDRVDLDVTAALEHLVGLQAQSPQAPYLGLWTRLRDFEPERLSTLIADRRAVRAVLMRATIHLVTAPDCLAFWPLVVPVLEASVYPNTTYGRHRLDGLDVAAVLAAGRTLVEEEPRSAAELRDLLVPQWPDRDPAALAYLVRQLLPLVHVPPRGLWRASGQPRFTTVEAWLGRGVEPQPSIERMVTRYLTAFGPATVTDAQTWSGLTRLRDVVEKLPLARFQDERGRTLYDLPDAPRPDPDTPAPPRFLPEYDNLLVSHADRGHVMPDGYLARIATYGSFLLDGYVRGRWKLVRQGKTAVLRIEPFERLSGDDVPALEAEAVRVLEFVAAGASSRDVEVHRV